MALVDPMRPTADLDGEGLSYGVERRSRGKEESKFAEIAKVTAEAIESYVTLDWETGDNLATGYTIDRKLGTEGSFSTTGTTSTTTAFTDVAVTKGTTSTYVVYASNESGNSLPSAEVTLTFD